MTGKQAPPISTVTPDTVGILLVPKYAMYVVTLVVESLRLANLVLGRAAYRWQLLSEDGRSVSASNGMLLTPDSSIENAGELRAVHVVAGYEPEEGCSPKVLNWLRRLDRLGTHIGGLDTGAYVLAKAGLIDNHVAAMHWSGLSAFHEQFPDIAADDRLFNIDGRRFTGAGGASTLDLMVALIARDHGDDVSRRVSRDLVHDQGRTKSANSDPSKERSQRTRNPELARVLRLMEDNLEDPLSMTYLQRKCGLSRRRLENIFRKEFGTGPKRYYANMRLDRARELVLNTSLPMRVIAVASGYESLAGFSRACKAQFSHAPRVHRTLFQSTGLGFFLPSGPVGLVPKTAVLAFDTA